MKLKKQQALIKRVMRLHENNTTEMMDTEYSRSFSDYLDKNLFAKEKALMKDYPIVFAYTSEIPNPGDYVTHDYLGFPVIVMRDKNGKAGAYLNVCRHRGTKIATEKTGNSKVLVCPYHAWSYDLQGKLIGLPDAYGFPGLKNREHNLVPLSTEEKHGCIWGMTVPGKSMDINAYLGDEINEDLSAWNLDSHTFYTSFVMRRKVNWKIGIELFLEAYHFKYAHKDSISKMFHNNLAVYDRFGKHLRYAFWRTKLDSLPENPDEWDLREFSALIYLLFPSTYLFFQPDHVSLLHVFPTKEDETVFVSSYLLPELPATQEAKEHWDKNIELFQKVLDEDLRMGEGIQEGARSASDDNIYFGKYEQALKYFRENVEEAIAEQGTSSP